MAWSIRLTRRSAHDLSRLSARNRQAVIEALDRAAEDLGSADLKKLGGYEDEWRLRVGQWRVRLILDNQAGTIIVARVLARKDAYRD
jgi:mRNA interferase RelE/StbE